MDIQANGRTAEGGEVGNMSGLTDVGAFVIVCFCMIFAVVYGVCEIKNTNQSIKQLEKIKKQIDGMKPPKEG